WQDRAHNQYLDTLISYGVIGLVSFLAIWVTVFYSLAQTICRTTSVKDKKRLAMLGTVFVAYLVFILTMFDTPSQLLVLFAGLALVVSRQEQVKVEPSIEFGGQISQRAVLLVVTLSLSTIVIWINLAPVVRAASIQQAIIQLRSNRSELESLLAKAFRPPNMYIHEMRYTMVTEVQKYHEWAQLRSPEMMAGIRYLATQAEMSANERPFSTCHQISAATVNRLLAAYEPEALDRSEKYAQRLIDLTPNRFDGYLEMAEVAILRDNYDRALELLTEADQRVYARRTDFRARILLLMATARAGQREFDLMTELVAEAEELDPNAYFDARPVIVLARTIQAGDQLDDSLVDFIDRVAGKYSLVPDVKNALEIIRQATIVPTHDSGSTQPEIK
ncbi:hypothetical protein KKC47_03755, partial [Patescibacteria group bacterium]|nr:hypothetical protein [Patescibacteria group bacterium]